MAKFDAEKFHQMLEEMSPHIQRCREIVEKYYPDGSLPYWTEILEEDPDADLGVGGDDACGDVWGFLTNGMHSFP